MSGAVVGDDVGLVIPVYRPNVERLERYANELRETLEPAALRMELDAPREGVAETLEGAGFEVHAVDERRGKGAAISDGFDALDADILAFVDADASTAIPSVQRTVETVANGTDVAVGSRRHPEAQVTDRSLPRAVLSTGLVMLARASFDVSLSDYQCGLKALRREVWDNVGHDVDQTGFAWDMDFLVAANQASYEIEEVPIEWDGGSSSSLDLPAAIQEFSRALVTIRRRSREQGGR